VTSSASTPRLRLTLVYYVLLIAAAATVGTSALSPPLDLLMGTAAFALAGLAALGRIWCSLFIAGRKDAELVTNGPYAMCRHPLYLMSLVGGLGLGLATRSFVLALVTLVVLAVLLHRAAAAEDRVLALRHPQAFPAYAGRVPRWWPRWRSWDVPPSVTAQPQMLWKAFVDAGAFLLLYALVEAARYLRLMGLSPTLLTLP
jgi:protein-S-isoprenylcysteine O-methyltransferase Ste14